MTGSSFLVAVNAGDQIILIVTPEGESLEPLTSKNK
jgi:hypothetical protein